MLYGAQRSSRRELGRHWRPADDEADNQNRGETTKPTTAEPEATVRFTVDLPRSLHKRLKLAAVNRDQAMTDLARQALLAEWLERQA